MLGLRGYSLFYRCCPSHCAARALGRFRFGREREGEGQLEQQAFGRQRKSFLSLLGPPQVSASTQRDGGAKRHQFTNKGPTSPTTKETYVIEPTAEPQFTLTCQPPLISFVNFLCCLPNGDPVTCGLRVYKGKCLDSLPKTDTYLQLDSPICLIFPKKRVISRFIIHLKTIPQPIAQL